MTKIEYKATLVFILDFGKRKVLLLKTKGGISTGKHTGLGGHVEKGESDEECAVREVKEESGLDVERLFDHGRIKFSMEDHCYQVRLYSTDKFSGKLRPSSEGTPKWFGFGKIPYENMWDDAKYWLPLVLQDLQFEAEFVFHPYGPVSKKGDPKVSSYNVRPRAVQVRRNWQDQAYGTPESRGASMENDDLDAGDIWIRP